MPLTKRPRVSTKSKKSKHQKTLSLQHQSKRTSITTPTGRKIVVDNVFESFSDAVGNTPLIKLQHASKLTGCNI